MGTNKQEGKVPSCVRDIAATICEIGFNWQQCNGTSEENKASNSRIRLVASAPNTDSALNKRNAMDIKVLKTLTLVLLLYEGPSAALKYNACSIIFLY